MQRWVVRPEAQGGWADSALSLAVLRHNCVTAMPESDGLAPSPEVDFEGEPRTRATRAG